MLGARCPNLISEDRYAVNVLNVVLGGGMSSRLFQTIREDHGLAYSVYTYLYPLDHAALLLGGVATQNERAVGLDLSHRQLQHSRRDQTVDAAQGLFLT